MTIYTVHAPPAAKFRAGRDEGRSIFVKEGFCWPGFVVPLPWLLIRGMWFAAAFYIIAIAAAAMLARQAELLPFAIGIAVFAPLLLGFEGNDLRRWSLGLRGYELVGVVEAASADEADIRYFAGRDAAVARSEPPPLPPSVPTRLQPLLPSPEVVGLFPTTRGTP